MEASISTTQKISGKKGNKPFEIDKLHFYVFLERQ